MLFSPDHIIPNLKANERFSAIRELVAQLVNVRRIRPEDEDVVVEAAIKREKSMTTGVGCGYASPRARVDCVEDIVVVAGASASGVEFDGIDNQPVTCIVMFIIPDHSMTHELELIRYAGQFQKIWQQPEVRGQWSRSTSAEEIWSLLKPAYDACLRPLPVPETPG